MRRLFQRGLALLRRRRLERELDDEIAAHLELAERDARARGLSPAAARVAARRDFGGVEAMKEQHRARRSVRPIETLAADMRYGFAALRRTPAFAGMAIGVLALGIGANAAMFSLVDAVLLKPLPFPHAERIVRVWEAPRAGAMNSTSPPDFLDWRRLSRTFDALAAEQPISIALTGAGDAARIDGKRVTADYFRVLGVLPRLGRAFTADDEAGEPSVVLSHAAWQTYFGGDPAILQRRPVLDGLAHRIVGVLPPGAFDRDRAQVWKLLAFTPEQRAMRNYHWLAVTGRLRADASLGQAREDMRAIDARLADLQPAFKRDWTIEVEPIEPLLVGDGLRRAIGISFASAIVVLLIACANVANLLLARGAVRRRELAVRAALGAGRGRLIAQLLTETLVLALLGAAAGLVLAQVLLGAASPFLSEWLPYTAEVALDWRVVAFVAAVAVAVTLLVGVLPAVQTNVGHLVAALNQASRGATGGGRLRRTLVIGEVALSLVLVAGALLLFRSLGNLQRLETGVRIERVLTAAIDLPARTYPTAERAATFLDALSERLRAVPGVEAVALTTHLPLEWVGNGEGLFVSGRDPINVRFKRVDAGYFETFGVPIIAGRGLTRADRAGTPGVIVINETLARRLREAAGGSDPLGVSVTLSSPGFGGGKPYRPQAEIVGVIRSERVGAPWRPDPPVVYVPTAQIPSDGVKLAIRTAAEPANVLPALRAALRELDPNLPLGDVSSMREAYGRTMSVASRPAWIAAAFASVAVTLAALGLYGVLAHAVTQQRREIGIRMALGAERRVVLSQVLRGALGLIAIGLVLGLAGTYALTGVMTTLLFQVSPLDPTALAAACAAMLAIGVAAALAPARRASAVDPVTVLHEEG